MQLHAHMAGRHLSPNPAFPASREEGRREERRRKFAPFPDQGTFRAWGVGLLFTHSKEKESSREGATEAWQASEDREEGQQLTLLG